MALDFTALQTEFFARGFSDLNDASTGLVRAKRWLNDAYHEINGMADWSWRLATAGGAPPLTIPTLGTIHSVVDANNNPLHPVERRWLRQTFGDLTTAGTPLYYYVLFATSGNTTVFVYPTTTANITVDHLRYATELSAGTDSPWIPDRFAMSIVHYAVANAREDRGDQLGAQSARAQGDAIVARMMNELLVPQHQAAQNFAPAVGEDL